MPRTDPAYGATRCAVQIFPELLRIFAEVTCPISLRACYAMSGTDIACVPISLRACYAMYGTKTSCTHCRALVLDGLYAGLVIVLQNTTVPHELY
eukprot:1064646-Rhodomonas_salina.1